MYDVRIERYKLGYRSNSMKRNAKNSLYRVKNCRNLQVYSGKFLKKLKSAGVKDLTNIVSDQNERFFIWIGGVILEELLVALADTFQLFNQTLNRSQK